MDAKLSRPRLGVLIGIALIFHAVGLVGIAILRSDALLRSTPLHLSLMAVLIVIAFRSELRRFGSWAAITAVLSFWAEWLGVHTGLLFGDYHYGTALGPRLLAIPLLIGVNWVVVLAGACSLAARAVRNRAMQVLLAAALATGYDWIMEPAAVRLDYWSWHTAEIPAFNYLCWAGLAAVIAGLWQLFRLRGNLFAAGLFIIQLVFFFLLRILL